MESIKSIFNNMSDMSKLLVKMLVGIIIGLIAIFIIVGAIRLLVGVKKDYSSVENTMRSAAISYYKRYKKQLPSNGQSVEVKVSQLVQGEYMKDMSKYFGENNTCNGYVTVINNNDNYAYLPYLNCKGKYTTKTLYSEILANNSSDTESDGLYLDDFDNYVFKGEYVNNFLSFGGNIYRILRINADGTIRVLLTKPIKNHKNSTWDNRYNVEKKDKSGINDYDKSRIRMYLNDIYEDDTVFNSDMKALIASQDLCIGSWDLNSGDFSDTPFCAVTYDDQYIGLVQANEYYLGSIDPNCNKESRRSCSNYNFMTTFDSNYWSITPVLGNTYQTYMMSGGAVESRSSSNTNVLFTLHISGLSLITDGDGSAEKPFIVKIPKSK